MKNHITQSNFGKCLKFSVALVLGLMLGTLLPGGGQAFAQNTNSIFGPNVTIIPAGTSEANIEAALNNIAGSTYNANPTGGQFSTNRNAVLFMPGTYTVQAPIGYYTSIAGLGQNPGDVVINGFITPNFGAWSNWCTGSCPQVPITSFFWRSMENMTINAATDAPQGGGANTLQWGVSQGAPLRRMQVNGALELTNSYCGNAAGGFLADTAVTGQVNSCSQTQWYTRNSSIGSWINGVWNMVFSGVTGAPTPNYPVNSYTVLPTTPVVREKPFLYVDGSSNFWVFSPSLLTNSSGTSWAGGGIGSGDAGTSLAISTFFIATPSSALADINTALAAGQNLILTPGIYQYSGSINVTNANTVVLGLGYADIVPQNGTPAITVADVDGVQIAGLLIDAGPVNSPILLQVGVAGTDTGVSHASNPTSINDVFFRIGGATAGTATESLEVDSDNVIIDNSWIWRADHGNAGTFGWTVNTAANGLVVNGANVTALGLAVEHYQANQVVWNGQGGETIFLESELPYDVPSQSEWMDGSVDGYASYYVSPTVTTHTTYGLGVYSFFNESVNIVDTSAISVPNAVGVTATDSVSVFLGGSGSITYTIDNAGTAVNSGATTSYVPFYQGVACTATCPAAATNLTATLTYPSGSLIPQIDLAWTPGTTTNAVYTIYRGSTPNFTPSVANQLVAGISNATTTYTDSSVTNGSGYYYVVQSQTLGGVAYSNVASVGIPAAGGVITTDVVAINAGGPAIAGTSWAADEDVTGGGTESNNGATVTIPVGMVGAAPQAVYQTMHNGAFTYAIPGLNAGQTYIVNLHFNEDWVGIPTNGRIFNILINGATALSNFNIAATAGGSNVANIQSFTATADPTGKITVAATAVTNNPIIAGIEIGTGILAGSPTGTTPPVQPVGLNAALPPTTGVATSALPVTLTWIASSTPGVTYNVYRSTTSGFAPSTATRIISGVTKTTFEDYSASGGTTYYYVVQAVSTGGTINSNQATATTGTIDVMSSDVFDINCGTDTTNVAGTLGVNWVPDASAATTVPSNPTAPGFTVSGGGTDHYGTTVVPAGLIDAAPALVYQTFHAGVFTYTIFGLTPSTEYLVNLHLAEDYHSLPNQRVYNIIVNGVTVLPNYDAVAATGAAHIANVQAVSALSDSNGTITVSSSDSIPSTDNPLLAGIEVGLGVLPGNPTGPNPPAQPTHLTATAISAAQVNLSWNPSSTPGVTYGVFRSTTGGFTPSAQTLLAGATGLTATTYVDSTVSGSATYYYIVQALASDGISTVNSNQASVTTPFANGVITNTIIAIDAGLDANFVLPYGISSAPFTDVQSGFTWQQDTTNSALNVTFSGASTAAANVVGITLPSGVTDSSIEFVLQTNRTGASQWVFGGFTPGQTYIVDLYFEESYFTTPNQRVFNVTLNGVPALTNFDIEAVTGGAHIGTVQSFAVAADSNGNITVATLNVINSALISGIQIGTGIVGIVPAPPTSLTATAASDSEIDLIWTASPTANVTYNIYGSTTSGFTPGASNLLQAGVTGTTYKNTGLANYTTYYYSVDAINANSGNPINSGFASASATTLPPSCTTLPTVPTTVVATAASDTEIDLMWAAGAAPAGCNVSYQIYRGLTPGNESTTPINSSTDYNAAYSDTGLTASTSYFYYVIANDEAGSSAASAQANATTLATGATLWTQVWGDDFTGAANTTYDHTKWWNEVEVNTGNVWGDSTIQSTSDSLSNVYLDGNGHLVEAMTYNPTPGVGQTTYTSGRLHSIQNIGYGRIDASIQNPSAPGMGAAFWAMGSDAFGPGTGPGSSAPSTAGGVPWPWCGELDMMELQASNPAHNGSTIHGGETDSQTSYEYGGVSATMNLPSGEPNFDQGFHTITTLWGPYHVQYFMDGVQYGDVNLANIGATDVWPLMGPSDNYTLNLIISSGIGGNGGTPGTTGFPSNYTFDYVHYSTLTAGVPSPVTGLTASQVYSNAVQLNWTASATAGVTYNIYASTNPAAKLDLSTLIEQNASATSFLAGGLNPGTTYHFTVLASNWGGESSNTTVQATTSPVGNSTGVQMSAGSYAVGSYISSQYVLGGNTNYHYGNVVNTSLVANPAPAEVYTTERWGAAAWTITGLNPLAGYNVRLHFVEAAYKAAGQRNFNVSINSALVLNNFDIFAAAGAANTAVTQEFYTQADENGIIELQTLMGTTSVGDLNPTITAIEIIPTSTSNPPVGSAVGATPGTTTDLAIASGAPVATGKFVADEDFNGGDSNAPYPYTATVALNANSAPQGVYDYERYVPFTYILTGLFADAPYTVNLHFAEMYWTGPGDRIFNVVINGNTVLPSLDVYKVAGGKDIAFDPQFTASADMYGQIILQFTNGGADNPFINGLEVIQGSSSHVLPVLTTPTPGSTLAGSSVTFTWSTGYGPTAYELWLGTTGVGSDNLYNSGGITATSASVTGLPANGVTVYARLYSKINGAWQSTDYTYTEAGTPVPAVLTTPTPGSVLTGSSVAFAWTGGAGPAAYQLYLGTTGVGSKNLYDSGSTTATTETVNGLPTTGVTVYARLYQLIDGKWQSADYLYTEAGTLAPAALTSPTPGSVLAGSSVTFAWTGGAGPAEYQLWLGTTGVGSYNLYDSGSTTATTKTVSGLPTNGATVFARLYQLIDGKWQSTDYTYTEAGTLAPAALTTPTPGSVLPGSTVTFAWTGGAGPAAYQLWLGTTGVGSKNLYDSGSTTGTTETVSGLPTTGGTVYARLWWEISGVWQHADYTYTAP
jgi:fibronectin type 3 domain-containing protein